LRSGKVTVKVGYGHTFTRRPIEGIRSMSVTLINIFEVPAGDEDAFIAAWEKTRDYLMTLPAHIETALHQSLHDARFRFVNIAQWTSEEEFNAAIGSQGFRESASELRWPMSPALYQVVRTG
jgi:heme-degrading monooxygenase HmoA